MRKSIAFVCLLFLLSNVSLAQTAEEKIELPAIDYAVEAGTPGDGILDVIINPLTGHVTVDTNGIGISGIIIDSEAGIFNGPNSPSWDIVSTFDDSFDIQIAQIYSFSEPAFYNGIDDLGVGIIGVWPSNFDYFADLTVSYNGEIQNGHLIIVPEPSSFVMLTLGCFGMMFFFRKRFR